MVREGTQSHDGAMRPPGPELLCVKDVIAGDTCLFGLDGPAWK
jgi:hypothetical protein